MNLINSVTSGMNFNFNNGFFNGGFNNVNNINIGNYGNNEEYMNENELFKEKKKQFILELDEFQFKHLKKYSALKEEKCPICLQKYKGTDIIKEFPCKHIFHKNCRSAPPWSARSTGRRALTGCSSTPGSTS